MYKKAKTIAVIICVVALVVGVVLLTIQRKRDSAPLQPESGDTVSNDSAVVNEPKPVSTTEPESETATGREETTETTLFDTTEAPTDDAVEPVFSTGNAETQESESTTAKETTEPQPLVTLPPDTPEKGDQGTDWV